MVTQLSSIMKLIYKHKYYIAFTYALLLAVILTFITYPGIIYSDSYSRLGFATSILQGGYHSTWLTPIPSFVMAFCYHFVNNWAFYTFLQAFFFFFAIFTVAIQLARNNWPIAILLLTTPTFLAYSVYHEMSVVTVAAMLYAYLLILYFLNHEKTTSTLSHVSKVRLFSILLVLAWMTFLFLGYRQNAFTVLPVYIVFCIFLSWKKERTKKGILPVCAIMIGALSVSLFGNVFSSQQLSTSSAGFAWELLNMIKILPAEKQKDYEDYLDDIFGEGNTMAAAEAANYDSVNSIFEFAPKEIIGIRENSNEIFKRYVEFFKNEPRIFLNVKWQYIENSLKPLAFREYDYNRWEAMDEYRFNDTPQRLAFVEGFNEFSREIAVFCAPRIMFLLASFALVYQWYLKKQFAEYAFLFCLATFYYGAFLINTQSFEFRYFFPSFCILYMVITFSILKAISRFIAKRLKKHPRTMRIDASK